MDKKVSILITGASTGIGRACALSLDKQGFKIYAGVRNQKDYEDLSRAGSEKLQPVILDVCNPEDVRETMNLISRDKDYPLYGLVNNAGIGISGLIEATPIDTLKRILDVNFIGLHRITQAALPIIRKHKGRVVNMGSSSSFMSVPALGPYAASKFALRAYTDALRIEMKTFGVAVSLIAPGPVESAIWAKARSYKEEVQKQTDPSLLKDYEIFVKAGDKLLDSIRPIPVIHAVKAVNHALTARKPKTVYLVGRSARLAVIFSRFPKRFIDSMILNRIRKAATHH